MSDLLKYLNTEGNQSREVRRSERDMIAKAQVVRNEVRIKALEADGAIALGAHIMEGLTDLDAQRRGLANGDQMLNMMLGEIEVNTVRAVKNIQNSLFNQWGL